MARNKEALKARIHSVRTTKKITSAMQMIADAKLGKKRSEMERNRDYALKLQEIVNGVLNQTDVSASEYLKEHFSNKAFNVLYCSDMGLCGSYNANMLKFAENNLNKEDMLLVIGTNLHKELKDLGFNVINDPISIETLTYFEVITRMNDALELYLKDEISSINLVYTKFENVMSYTPTINEILPYKKQESVGNYQDIEFEPSVDKVLDNMIEMMVNNLAYALAFESKTSEQASRRNAMESATDNAKELEDNLLLQYNQARQAAITQEINEIVSGANAL